MGAELEFFPVWTHGSLDAFHGWSTATVPGLPVAGKATSPTHGDSPSAITLWPFGLFAGCYHCYHTIYSWLVFLTSQTYLLLPEFLESQICLKCDICEDKWRESLTQKRDAEGRQGTRYLRTITEPILKEYLPLYDAVNPVSWSSQSDYGDRIRTTLG